ncbi:hypothetical protein FRX31_013690 [Thalictrum thalictroides]|uniref:Aminotransferase-like plant mobile domain-containing protein n=1 Tax=Thalictrum thalictroides TaxID=46969 RepID=A0A7J6WID1_THATH|nr:hypothetical protein FRX31_013690 [Thalictrum thalictroides]
MMDIGDAFDHIWARILATPFGPLVSLTPIRMDWQLLFALLERWWLTTHTFHLPLGELGLTPLDFTMITGLRVGSGEIVPYFSPYDVDESEACHLFPMLIEHIEDDSKLRGLQYGFFESTYMLRTCDPDYVLDELRR